MNRHTTSIGVHPPPTDRAIRAYVLILGALALLSLVTNARLGLALDEAYYWYWAKHPALSYLDHPPLVAWLMALSTAVGGDSPFFVRLGGLMTLWIGFAFAFGTARRLFPGAPPGLAWEYLLLLNLTLIFSGAITVQTPDTPLFALWMACLYFGARVVVEQAPRAWYGLGLCLGLGMLGKYTMVLLAPGMLLFLLLSPPHRHWLGRKEPWLAALLALAAFSPVLIWNGLNHWVSFGFQLHQGFTPDQVSLADKLLEYLAGQALIVNPPLFLVFLVYGGYATWLAFREGHAAYRFLALLCWPPLLFFAWTGARGAQAEANWPAPAHLAGLLLAWAGFRLHFAGRPAHRRWVIGALALALVLLVAIRVHLTWPWLPLPAAQDRTREFYGWDALGRQVEEVIREHPGADGWFLAGDQGTVLAQAIYHTGNRYPGIDFARPERYLFLDDPNREWRGRNAVLLIARPRQVLPRIKGLFRRITPLGPYRHRYRGVVVPKHATNLFLGEGFLGNWTAFDRLKE